MTESENLKEKEEAVRKQTEKLLQEPPSLRGIIEARAAAKKEGSVDKDGKVKSAPSEDSDVHLVGLDDSHVQDNTTPVDQARLNEILDLGPGKGGGRGGPSGG